MATSKEIKFHNKAYTFGNLRFLWEFFSSPLAYGILAPQPRIELGPSAVKMQSPNHWSAREFPAIYIFDGWDKSNVIAHIMCQTDWKLALHHPTSSYSWFCVIPST